MHAVHTGSRINGTLCLKVGRVVAGGVAQVTSARPLRLGVDLWYCARYESATPRCEMATPTGNCPIRYMGAHVKCSSHNYDQSSGVQGSTPRGVQRSYRRIGRLTDAT